MTKDEAIAMLKVDGCGCCTWQSLNPCVCENKECELKEALNMAISALEQQPCEDAERIDYHDDFATALKKISDYEMTRDERAAISILNAYKVGYESGMEEKLEQIRAEIKQVETYDDSNCDIVKDEVLEILNKYTKGE